MASSSQVAWARALAERLLRPLGRRWSHVERVGALAKSIAPAFGQEGDFLVAAAYVHDIGYAPELAREDFHPLDGARYLRGLGRERLAGLVAHHSGARVEAQLRGMPDYLSEFPYEPDDLQAALTFCDLTTGPDGDPVSLSERVAEINRRYGPGHVTARAITACLPEFELFQDRTEARVRAARSGGLLRT